MATEVEDRDVIPEPGIGLALMTVLAIIATIAVLSVLIWGLMVGVAATTAGRNEAGNATPQSGPLIDQKAQPAKQPAVPAKQP